MEEAKPKTMSLKTKTLVINLVIQLVYIVYLIAEPNVGRFADFGDLLALTGNTVLQVAICLIASLVYYTTDRKERGRAFLLSAIVVAAIAFIVGLLMAN
jgi:hypothetical protein